LPSTAPGSRAHGGTRLDFYILRGTAILGLANNLLNRKDMGCATAAAMPGKIPSEKQCILPRGHKSRLNRQAVQLGYNLVELLKRLELEGLKQQDG